MATIYCIQQYACAKNFKTRGIFGIAHIANEGGQYDPAKGQCLFINKFILYGECMLNFKIIITILKCLFLHVNVPLKI